MRSGLAAEETTTSWALLYKVIAIRQFPNLACTAWNDGSSFFSPAKRGVGSLPYGGSTENNGHH